MAATDGVGKALVGDVSPQHLSGTAYGVFAAVSGVAVLIASVTAGFIWEIVSPAAVFYVGAAFALASLPLLFIATRPSDKLRVPKLSV